MAKKSPKLFDETMPGNFMPANRGGCIAMLAFIGLALAILVAGIMLDRLFESPWPSRASWVLFVVVIVRLVIFARKHS